jgi:hypothetical protein
VSTTILIEYACDEPRCTAAVRAWHWTALGAQSGGRRDLRLAGWLALDDPGPEDRRGPRRHYCAAHRDGATYGREMPWPNLVRRTAMTRAWERGEPLGVPAPGES